MVLNVNVFYTRLAFCIFGKNNIYLIIAMQDKGPNRLYNPQFVKKKSDLYAFLYSIAYCNVFGFSGGCWHSLLFFAAPRDYSSIDKKTVTHDRLSIFKVFCVIIVDIPYKSVQSWVEITDPVDNSYLHCTFKIADDALGSF